MIGGTERPVLPSGFRFTARLVNGAHLSNAAEEGQEKACVDDAIERYETTVAHVF